MELGQLPVSGLSPALQASSLSIARAYLMSLSRDAAEALTGDQCPGKGAIVEEGGYPRFWQHLGKILARFRQDLGKILARFRQDFG